jgi:hypothetical protein
VLKLRRYHLARSDRWFVAATSSLQIFLEAIQSFIDAFAVSISNAFVIADEGG